MRIKTYVFEDVKKGMERIKEEFGPNAIIVDVKHNGKIMSRQTCEISVAVETAESREDDPVEFRRKAEDVWSYTTKLLIEKLSTVESEIIRDRAMSYPLPLRILFDKMVKNGFDPKLAVSMISEVYSEIGKLADDSMKANYYLKKVISQRIKIRDIIQTDEPLLMLGLTGAGKTRTTKKLANMLKKKEILKFLKQPMR